MSARWPLGRRLGIGLRITLWWTALFAACLLVFAVLSAALVERARTQSLERSLEIQAQLAASVIDGETGRLERDVEPPDAAGFTFASYRGDRLLDRFGPPLPADVARDGAAIPLESVTFVRASQAYYAVAAPVGDFTSMRVVVFAPNAPLEEEEGRVRAALAATALPMLAIAALVGWFLARRMLQPIDAINAAASEVARSGRLTARLSPEGDDELARLARTFNEMLERLEASFERERGFIGDVSHEVRQPLAAISGEADLALRRPRDAAEYGQALEAIRVRSERLARLIDDLLVLARADAGVVGRRQPGELNEAASTACAEVQRRGPGMPVTLQLSDDPYAVRISGALLVRVVENLVANARRAARTLVRVVVERRGDQAVLVVEDDGPGIPPAEREAVFRRFYRRDASPDGTGLGLPIAAAVAHAAGGEIRVEERPGGGARLVVSFPIAR